MIRINDDRIEESLDLGQNRAAAAGSVVTTRPFALASGNYPQQAQAREIAVVSHKRCGVNRQCARRLDRVGQPEPQRSTQPGGTRCNFQI
jgi:hypothetical protein